MLIEAVACSRLTNVRLRGKTMQRLVIRDETASGIITWFNQPYLKDKFVVGHKYKFFGKVSKKGGKVTFNSPVFDAEEKSQNTGRIIPIYPLTYNLITKSIKKDYGSGNKRSIWKLTRNIARIFSKRIII